MPKPAYNPTDRPVVIDDDGHTLGGREWGAADPDTDRVRALVDAGELVLRDDLPKNADPQVRAAVEAAMGRPSAAEPAGEGTADPGESAPSPANDDPDPAAHAAKRSAR